MRGKNGPVLFDLDEADAGPASAPPVPDLMIAQPAAMQRVAAIATRKGWGLAGWFWSVLVALTGFVISLAAYDFALRLIERSPVLGGIATALLAAFVLILLVMAGRELGAIGRLSRIDGLRNAAQQANSVEAARDVTRRLSRLYRGREDTQWGRDRLAQYEGDILDADGLLALAETELLAPLDARARGEVEAAARQVATVTAIVPLALADVAVALTSNLRMIRRIAEIYGGRSGLLGSWRMIRAVLTHLVATGAVAVGDDLISSVAGGGVLSKISRRFGEGVINGALTARVGVAAMEVCRPLPFKHEKKPAVTSLVKRALTGLFSSGKD